MDSDQALNLAYNPRLVVADHQEVMARWRIKSAQARQDSICLLDIPYGLSALEALDIFQQKKAMPLRFYLFTVAIGGGRINPNTLLLAKHCKTRALLRF